MDLLTDEENNILLNMVDKCEDLEFAKDPNFDACDYAFELEKCWKRTDPEVIIIMIMIAFMFLDICGKQIVDSFLYLFFLALLCSVRPLMLIYLDRKEGTPVEFFDRNVSTGRNFTSICTLFVSTSTLRILSPNQ